MTKQELINKWQIDIANCEQIIKHHSYTDETKQFTKGEMNAISECINDLKNLTIPLVINSACSGCMIYPKELYTKGKICKSCHQNPQADC